MNQEISSAIRHPAFRLDKRPDVIEVLYKDVFRTIMAYESDLNLYSRRSEDYVDDTKEAPKEVERSVRARINFIKYEQIMRKREAELRLNKQQS